MVIGFGATVIPSLAQAFIGHMGWRSAYVAIAILALMITLPASIVATRNTRFPLRVACDEGVAIMPLIFTRAFPVMCGIFVLLAIGSGGAFTGLIPMLVDRGDNPRIGSSNCGARGSCNGGRSRRNRMAA